MRGVAGARSGDWSLHWLRNLRWTAVAGQTVTVLFVEWGLGIRLPLGWVFPVIGLTALTNGVLHVVSSADWERRGRVTGLLVFDVVVLTLLLHLTGGPHNPFTFFYLVHVALAAVVLPATGSMIVAAACVLGYGALFLGLDVRWRPGDDVCGVGPGLPLSLHLKGMLVAFGLAAACVTFFVGRMQTALRRQTEELARARLQAASNERFAAMATLAAGAAHELGTPLGTIAIASGELSRNVREGGSLDEAREDAELIREEAMRCRSILDRLQDQTGDAVREVGVAQVLEGVARRVGEGRVKWGGVPVGLTVAAPPEALSQALSSLVKNALDATPSGKEIRMAVEAGGGRVRFLVEDEGTGLAPGARLHAGEPFFTTKPAGQGMGLGLFLVRLLAQRMGGEFRLEAREGGGTRALLDLPAQGEGSDVMA